MELKVFDVMPDRVLQYLSMVVGFLHFVSKCLWIGKGIGKLISVNIKDK